MSEEVDLEKKKKEEFESKINELKNDNKDLQEKIKKLKQENNDSELKKAPVNEAHIKQIKVQKSIKGHVGKIYSLAWAPDGLKILTAAQDQQLLLWDVVTGKPLINFNLKTEMVMTCSVSPSGELAAAGGLDNTCSIYSIKDKTKDTINEDCYHNGYLSCSTFLDDKQILTSSGDQTSILWDIEKSKAIKIFTGHTGDVMTNAISPIDKATFLSGSTDSTIKVFDIKGGKCVQTFKGMESDVNSVKFFPNGWSFAAGGEDGSIKLFDIRASGVLGNYQDDNYRESVNTISFSVSGRFIFGSYDLINESRITVWDTIKEQKLSELTDHKDRTTCIAVSPNGYALASCSWDQLVKIYC